MYDEMARNVPANFLSTSAAVDDNKNRLCLSYLQTSIVCITFNSFSASLARLFAFVMKTKMSISRTIDFVL